MMAEKYVMRAPSRYSGFDDPGTLVRVQLAIGMWVPMSVAAFARILLASASVAAGACRATSVNSSARMAFAITVDARVC